MNGHHHTHRDSAATMARGRRATRELAVAYVAAFAVGALLIAGAAHVAAGDEHDHDAHGAHDDHGHAHGTEEGGHSDEVTLSPDARQLYGVTVAVADRRRLADLVTVPARVVLNPERTAHVGVPVEGRVVELRARVGDRVAVDDILAILDSPAIGEAESEFLQRQAGVATARTTVEVARKAFERAQDLGSGSGITVTEFQKREGEMQLAQGALTGAEAMAQAVRNKLRLLGVSSGRIDALAASGEISSRYEVRAPIAGDVIEREVTLGEIVGPDRDALVVVADLSAPWVMADVPERDLARIAADASAAVSFGALPGIAFAGRVAHVAAVLDVRSRKGTVRIELSGAATGAGSTPGGEVSKEPHADPAHADHDHATHADHDHDAPGHDHEAHDDDHASHDHAPAATGYTDAQIADYKSRGDWCGEHGVPESACVLCNPSLARQATPVPALAPPAPAPPSAPVVLRAGMFGEAELTLSSLPGQPPPALVVVPLTAIQTVEGGPAVFVPVAGEPNTFAKRAVTVGPRTGRWVPILSGLSAGESYVATGTFILKADLGKEGAAHEH